MEILEKKMKPQLKVILGGKQGDKTAANSPSVAPHLEVVQTDSQGKCVGGACSIQWKPTRPTAA